MKDLRPAVATHCPAMKALSFSRVLSFRAPWTCQLDKKEMSRQSGFDKLGREKERREKERYAMKGGGTGHGTKEAV